MEKHEQLIAAKNDAMQNITLSLTAPTEAKVLYHISAAIASLQEMKTLITGEDRSASTVIEKELPNDKRLGTIGILRSTLKKTVSLRNEDPEACLKELGKSSNMLTRLIGDALWYQKYGKVKHSTAE